MRKNLFIVTLAAIMSILVCAAAGCGKNERTLNSISVDQLPVKVEYVAGETFDATGMVIKANYSDNTSEIVTNYTIDKTGALTLEDEFVTVTYESKTATVAIVVKAHTHLYNKEVAEEKYLASAATCTAAAKYYKSCECGAKGTETFTVGEALGHDVAGVEWSGDGENHWKVCKREGCGVQLEKAAHSGGTATCAHKAECEVCHKEYGETIAHTFDKEVAEEKYLASAATCTAAAKYYKSCECGEKGTETFTVGEALGHDVAGVEWSGDGENHWKVCEREGCGAQLEKAAHSGGTATCAHKAECEVCHRGYGETTDHHYGADGNCEDCGTRNPDLVAAEAVDELITNLPAVDGITYADKEAVEAARTGYDALNAVQKELVKNLNTLVEAEAKIAELGRQVKAITLSGEFKTLFFAGDVFTAEGLAVTAERFNGESYELASGDYTVSQPDMENAGKVKVTVTVKDTDVTAEYEITVKAYDAVISSGGFYLVEAENLDQSEWIIQAGREGMQIETPSNPTSGGKSVGSLTTGSKVIINIKSDIEATVSLTAMLAQISDKYKLADNVKFTVNGNVLTYGDVTFGEAPGAQYTNWKEVVFDGFDLGIGKSTFIMEIVGEGINIDCFKFTVTDKNDTRELTGIEITTLPAKTSYNTGDAFDPTGMVVTAVYANGDKEPVTGYTVDKTVFMMEDVGTATVTVDYMGKTATFDVTVVASQVKIAAPDNSGNKLMCINGAYLELDRYTNEDGAKISMFADYVDHVKVYIYASVDADKSQSLGSFKITGNESNFGGTIASNDGTIVQEFVGEPTNGHVQNVDNGPYNKIIEIIAHELGDSYTEGNSYYLAFQRVAKETAIGGIIYGDSDISDIGTFAWAKI